MSTAWDPVAGHLETFERLRGAKRWSTDIGTVRFAALALGRAGLDVEVERLVDAAWMLRQGAGWTSPLRSEVRHVVAAMILREGLDPETIRDRVVATRDGFREHGIPRRQPGATFAALVLVLRSAEWPVPDPLLVRLGAIYRRWRSEHFWLTSANDLPAAALHACGDREVEMLVADIERAYARLAEAGFRRGNALRLASHLLATDTRGVETGVERFRRMAERLRSGVRVRPGRYDEVAMLALARGDVPAIVERVLDYRDRLRAAKPRPSRDIAFTLAAEIVFSSDTEDATDRSPGHLAALRSIQAIVNTRRAAVGAAVGAGVASQS